MSSNIYITVHFILPVIHILVFVSQVPHVDGGEGAKLRMPFHVVGNRSGEKVEELNQTEEGVLVHSFDLTELEKVRTAWGVFRDRRPNLYWPLSTLDGETPSE